jgi:purine nucleosidase
MIRVFVIVALLSTVSRVALSQETLPDRPVPIIFDTDMGNDVDDALALGVIHALESRGECKLLAVTVTKDHPDCAPFVDAVNTFYGRGKIPVGVVRKGVTPKESKFTTLVRAQDKGKPRYPHDLVNGADAPEASAVLRKALAAQADQSVVIVQVGFSTNLARLLDSKADDASPLDGVALAAQKVRLISVMAGAFQPIRGAAHKEYNVVMDLPAAKKLAQAWPTPIVFSGFEIGLSIPYPAASIDEDFGYVPHHILAEAYQLYMPTPHERPTWDLTSVLWAARPHRGYFDCSAPGRVTVDDEGITTFAEEAEGPHRYLIVNDLQRAQVREALTQLSSQPPKGR